MEKNKILLLLNDYRFCGGFARFYVAFLSQVSVLIVPAGVQATYVARPSASVVFTTELAGLYIVFLRHTIWHIKTNAISLKKMFVFWSQLH